MTQTIIRSNAAPVVSARPRAAAVQVVAAPEKNGPAGAFAVMSELGAVTAAELGRALGISKRYAQTWLRWAAQLDYLHRDETGRYANFCAIPRGLY